MQTDPNWGNFLYNEATKTINLIDFGAARDFPKSFVDDYLRMVGSFPFLFILFFFVSETKYLKFYFGLLISLLILMFAEI